jgi:cytidylate kinase
MEGLLVTIDGPAGSGKSSVARAVAERLGLVNLNTGAAYRAVALLALHEGADPADADTLSTLAVRVGLGVEEARVDGQPVPEEKLRTPEVTAVASQVSAHPAVREVLLNVQRSAADEARKSGGAVVEGRDIGPVVLPDAEVKVFLLAAPEERARRRAVQSGREGELDRIQAAMLLRDQRDAEREASPLKAASDAVVIDTTGLSLEDVVSQVVGLAERNKNHE